MGFVLCVCVRHPLIKLKHITTTAESNSGSRYIGAGVA